MITRRSTARSPSSGGGLPSATTQLAEGVARATAALRQADLVKAPGVAESIDWAEALLTLGATTLEPGLAARTLGAVLKHRDDQARILSSVLDVLTP